MLKFFNRYRVVGVKDAKNVCWQVFELKAIYYELAEWLVEETDFAVGAHGHSCAASIDQLPKKFACKLIALVDDKSLFVHFLKQGEHEGAWKHKNH